MTQIHKDIRIPFEIKGRRFEAVGFLDKGERSVDGDEMLSRITKNNHRIIDGDDVVFISKRFHLLPKKLHKFDLVTNLRKGDSPSSNMIFCCHYSVWGQFWSSLDYRWFKHELVLCRLL